MSNTERVEIKPIGFVSTKSNKKEIKNRSNVSNIILKDNLTKALKGIENFSHLFIIFWMQEISNEDKMKLMVHPRGRKDVPLSGVFATRTPHRPNPIGLTLVELLGVKQNVITVRGLDAFDGTPVLDIKTFDYWDIALEAKVPEWWIQLEKERLEEDDGLNR